MTSTALTSELEAVNTLLASIGESQVNTLEVTGLADLAQARQTLSEVSRRVQVMGWHWNTEDEFPLVRDSLNKIPLPPNVLKVVSKDNPRLVQRGKALYDGEKHTYRFESDIEATVVLLLDWDELPEAARQYVMIRASRIFQARFLGSDTQFRFSEKQEQDALTDLQTAEGETANHNIFTGSSTMLELLGR